MLVEVTDTVSLPYTTGMQRVARELLSRLVPCPDGTSMQVAPVLWSPAAEWYRTLTAEELDALANPQERLPTSTSIARRIPDPLASAVRRVLAVPAMRDLRSRARRAARIRRERPLVHLVVGPADTSTVLLDLEAAWNDPVPRDRLLPSIRRRGARSAVLVADVLPMLHPEWFDSVLVRDFTHYLDGHLRNSDLFLCISERTRLDLLDVARRRGIARELDTRVIPLGSDIVGAALDDSPDDIGDEVGAPITRFLLMVGTIEPRKNQALAIDVFDALAPRHPGLGMVLVGKRGWKVDALIERIERHPELGRRLLWLEEVDDARLSRLYRDAHLTLTPARYEGLGMSVTESLQAGTPVVASNAGALPEAGGDLAEYADVDDVAAWVRLVERHLDDPTHHQAAVERARSHRPPTWDESAAAVRAALADVFATPHQQVL
ncbi:MAG: glycosyltransferase family 4 protein [Actinobacteria bacterium]|nr:glycosyltransferase family 4 protein [Actinomycetota bacterium]